MEISIVYVCGVFWCLISGEKLDSVEDDYQFYQNFGDGEGSSSVMVSSVFNDAYGINVANSLSLKSPFSSKTSNSTKDITLDYLSRLINYSVEDQNNKRNLTDSPIRIDEVPIRSFIDALLSIKRLLGGKYTYRIPEKNSQWSSQASVWKTTRNLKFTRISRRSTDYGIYNSNMGQYAQQNSYSGQSDGYGSFGSGQQTSYGNQQYGQQNSYSGQNGGYASYGGGQQNSYGNQQNVNNAFGAQGYGYGSSANQPQNGGYGNSAQGGTYGYYGQTAGYTNNGYTGQSGYGSGFFFGTPYGSGTDPFDEWIAAFDAGYDAGVNSISDSSKDKPDNKDKDKNKNKNRDKDEKNGDNEDNNDNDGANDGN